MNSSAATPADISAMNGQNGLKVRKISTLVSYPSRKPRKDQVPHLDTASQLARAIGTTRQAVQQRLAAVPASTQTIVKGIAAAAWSFESLPAPMQLELSAAAERQGYRDAAHMLRCPDEPWKPRHPISKTRQDFIDKAVKLKASQERALPQKDALPRAALIEMLIADYKREFGHEISPDHAWRLFRRTIDRDRSQNRFTRLELFVDGDACREADAPATVGRAMHARHAEALAGTIKTLENPANPTSDDKKYFFAENFRHLETLCAEFPGQERQWKRSLMTFSYHAVPAMAKNKASFDRVFNMKLAAWKESGGIADALEDRRSMNSGNFRRPDFSEDEKKIRNLAILHKSNEALAHRLLWQSGELSPEYREYHSFDPRRNKSYVPASVRAAITPEVDMCEAIHRGPWQAKMRGPYITRNWDDVAPADWFSGDDVTWNNYFYFHDEAGRLHIERGECLLLHDLRTGYLLDYVLIAGKYNSRHIRKLMLAAHDKHGLPHVGYYYERGVWKARIITDIASKESHHWRETESGLAAYDLKVRHATTPRAKTIECLIRILQERQRSEPGFVGFNERTQEMERMQDFLAHARAGKAHPGEKLLHMNEWTKRLDKLFGEFNLDVQNGKMLPGISPAEAWQAGLDAKPLRKLPDEARYLLATHRQVKRVYQHGITLKIGQTERLFCNEKTGALIGREVFVYYNVECPELLTVSDLNRQNFFTVKDTSVPAMSATKEQFAAVRTQIGGHQKAARAIYGSIEHPKIATITRDVVTAPDVAALGEFHNAEVERFQKEKTATARTLGKIQRQAAASGLSIQGNIRNPDQVLAGIELEREARAAIEAERRAANDQTAP